MLSSKVRLRQHIFRNRTNSPYLSGDSFASICDYTAFSTIRGFGNGKDISTAKSIFCQSDHVEKLIERSGDIINAKILVLGNSDKDFYDFQIELPKSIKKVYLQNSHISDDFFQTLPIGLENLRLGKNGLPSLFNNLNKSKETKILVGPFSPTHNERSELIKWGSIASEYVEFKDSYLDPRKFSRLASEFLYIACPRGNGTDTHRFWETLYRGSIPVVKKSAWSESIARLQIPIIQLNRWDIEEFVEASRNFDTPHVNQINLSQIWIAHWEKLFQLNSQ